MKIFLTYTLYIIFTSGFFFSIRAQKANEIKKIERLWHKADIKENELKFNDCLKLNIQAKTLSVNYKFQEGIIKSDLRISKSLQNLYRIKESVNYTNKIEREYVDYIHNHFDYNFQFNYVVGVNYLRYGFKRQALLQFEKQADLLKYYKDPKERLAKQMYLYQCIASCFEFYNNDKAYFYMYKEASLLKKNKLFGRTDIDPIYQITVLNFYRNMADYHIYLKKNIDSAYFYNNLGLKLVPIVNPAMIYRFERQRAKILNDDKKYNQSIKYCNSSIARIRNVDIKKDLIDIYQILADNYQALGNEKQIVYYQKKYIERKRIETTQLQEGILISSEIMDFEKKEMQNSQSKTIYISVFVFICILLIGGIIFVKMKRKKIRLRRVIENQKTEVKNLEKKINNSFGEIVLLAKNNSPEFILRFREIYSDFYDELLKVEPKLLSTELKFCAFLYLNFSTKDISEYTFVTVKAVQHSKYRLRKKYNIPPDEDIIKFLVNKTFSRENVN